MLKECINLVKTYGTPDVDKYRVEVCATNETVELSSLYDVALLIYILENKVSEVSNPDFTAFLVNAVPTNLTFNTYLKNLKIGEDNGSNPVKFKVLPYEGKDWVCKYLIYKD